jgi:hypothetical protein
MREFSRIPSRSIETWTGKPVFFVEIWLNQADFTFFAVFLSNWSRYGRALLIARR